MFDLMKAEEICTRLNKAKDENEKLEIKAETIVTPNIYTNKVYETYLLMNQALKLLPEAIERIKELEDVLIEKQYELMPSAPSCYSEARRNAAIEQLQKEGLLYARLRRPNL
jgi:hypothetical protein